MELTGGVFVSLLLVLTVAVAAAVVVLWARLAGPGWRPVLLRVVGLVGTNVLVLASAAALLNQQFLFFADWQDLAGAMTGTQSSTAVQAGGGAASAARVTVSGPAAQPAASLPALPPLPAGSDPAAPIRFTVTGSRSGITAPVVVQLPPGYTDAAAASTRYPVLETFSGYPSTPEQWVKTMHLPEAIATQVAARKVRPILIVSPQVEIPAGKDTECVDGAGGNPKLETWLTQDVPDWVARTFRIDPARSGWATIGLSTGGWCAAMAVMLHPAQYSAAVVMGGYFRPQFEASYEPYPPGDPLAKRYDLTSVAQHQAPPVALWVQTSHSDPVSYGSTTGFLKATHPPTAVTAVVLHDAGHRIDVWRNLLPQALTWLGGQIPGFAPLG